MTTSFDATFTNALERALNTDEQLRDTLFGRSMAEALRAIVGSPTFVGFQQLAATSATLFRPRTRDHVWGLAIESVTGAPRQLTIGPGSLLADTGAEAAGPDDSGFRLGLNLANVTVPIPASDDLWHLLECRVVNTDVLEPRDILTNPVTRTYAPQNVVKRKLKRLTFQIITGTGSAIPAPTVGWTPLYGFVIPTAGPAIPLMSQFVDFRPSTLDTRDRTVTTDPDTFGGLIHSVISAELVTTSTVTPFAQSAKFRLSAELDGRVLIAQVFGGGIDLTRFLDTGGAPTSSTWHYIYLAPSPIGEQCGNAAWAGRQEAVISNCVLLMSTVTPDGVRRNSDPINCVAPFVGTAIAAGGAICVGALLQSAGGTGWEPQTVTRAGHAKIASNLLSHQVAVNTLVGQAQGVVPVIPLPEGIKTVDMQFGMQVRTPSQTAGGVGGVLLIKPVLQGVTAVNNEQSFGSVVVDPLIQERYQSITAPVGATSPVNIAYKVETRDSNGVIFGANGLLSQVTNAGALLNVRVTGFEM